MAGAAKAVVMAAEVLMNSRRVEVEGWDVFISQKVLVKSFSNDSRVSQATKDASRKGGHLLTQHFALSDG
jgi:hypothetical protein